MLVQVSEFSQQDINDGRILFKHKVVKLDNDKERGKGGLGGIRKQIKITIVDFLTEALPSRVPTLVGFSSG